MRVFPRPMVWLGTGDTQGDTRACVNGMEWVCFCALACGYSMYAVFLVCSQWVIFSGSLSLSRFGCWSSALSFCRIQLKNDGIVFSLSLSLVVGSAGSRTLDGLKPLSLNDAN